MKCCRRLGIGQCVVSSFALANNDALEAKWIGDETVRMLFNYELELSHVDSP